MGSTTASSEAVDASRVDPCESDAVTEGDKRLVTIGLPVHNGARFLERSLSCLLAQTYEPLEIVASDNASTDDTWPILTSFAERDQRIRLLRQDRFLGVFEHYETVLASARGERFAFGAVDDQWAPTFVESLVAELDRRPEAVAAMSAIAHEWWDGRAGEPVRFTGRDDPRTVGSLGRAWRQAGGRVPYFQYFYALYPTSFARRAFRGVPSTVSSDGLFAIQLALAGPWGYVDEVLTTRHVREIEWQDRYEEELARSIGHPLAEVKLLAAAVRYLALSPIIPLRRKPLVPLVLARLLVWRLPILAGTIRALLTRRRRAARGRDRR